MPTELHRYLLEEAQKAAAPQTLFAEELMTLLRKSKANIYKKIKGKTPFSAEETIAIARQYGISLDHFTHNGHGDFEKVSFDYSLPQHQPRSPERFLWKIHEDLARIVQIPQIRLLYASNEVPLFHSLACRQLLAFKLYVWARANWKTPEMLLRPFDVEWFYDQWPEVEALRNSILTLYQRIPSKEYWPRTVVNNILNQIRYYAQAQLFQDPTMPATLCRELAEMLDNRALLAEKGHKGELENGETSAAFSLYLNEIAYTNNIILVLSGDQPLGVYTTIDNPNFLRSTDSKFCHRMKQWIAQIEDCSFSVSTEVYRLSLFGDLKKQILDAQKAITL